MLPFYGRRLSRKTKNSETHNLPSFHFFLNKNFVQSLKVDLSYKSMSINLEIGFGAAENLIFQSEKFKNELFIACDPFISGSLKLKSKIEELDLKNVFFSNLDYFKLYELTKGLVFNKIYILFPDPWPKKKHKKRRLINLEFIKSLLKITSLKSKIFVATDDEDYSNQIRKCFIGEDYFKQEFYSSEHNDYINYNLYPTKYFKKAMSSKKNINFFIFRKFKKKNY